MRFLIVLLFVSLFFCQCETETFDADKRQIAAKNAIIGQLHRAGNFDIIGFKEDTLSSWNDSLFKQPIRYTVNFVFTDSAGTVQNRTGEVVFTPDGKSLLTAQINNPNP